MDVLVAPRAPIAQVGILLLHRQHPHHAHRQHRQTLELNRLVRERAHGEHPVVVPAGGRIRAIGLGVEVGGAEPDVVPRVLRGLLWGLRVDQGRARVAPAATRNCRTWSASLRSTQNSMSP